MDISFFDKFTWLTNEQKQELIEEDRKEADEIYAIKEKPRFEFFAVVQKSITRYFKEILDLDTDGWTMYNVLLFEEYTDYQLRFEHIDGFIEYEFGIEDLHIPYEEYSKKYSEKWKIQFDKRFNEQNDCNNESID